MPNWASPVGSKLDIKGVFGKESWSKRKGNGLISRVWLTKKIKKQRIGISRDFVPLYFHFHPFCSGTGNSLCAFYFFEKLTKKKDWHKYMGARDPHQNLILSSPPFLVYLIIQSPAILPAGYPVVIALWLTSTTSWFIWLTLIFLV